MDDYVVKLANLLDDIEGIENSNRNRLEYYQLDNIKFDIIDNNKNLGNSFVYYCNKKSDSIKCVFENIDNTKLKCRQIDSSYSRVLINSNSKVNLDLKSLKLFYGSYIKITLDDVISKNYSEIVSLCNRFLYGLDDINTYVWSMVNNKVKEIYVFVNSIDTVLKFYINRYFNLDYLKYNSLTIIPDDCFSWKVYCNYKGELADNFSFYSFFIKDNSIQSSKWNSFIKDYFRNLSVDSNNVVNEFFNLFSDKDLLIFYNYFIKYNFAVVNLRTLYKELISSREL